MVYVNYEYDRVYKPDKKYNIPKRTTIGKMCDDDPTMMYPKTKEISDWLNPKVKTVKI